MSEKISGIVLNVRKYNDRNNIVTLFTRSRGRLSFISPSGTGKASLARRARLQPLSVISTEFNYKSANELQRLGSITNEENWNDIYFHPQKRIITLFLSEFLNRLLNATMPEYAMYDFLISSLRFLDNMKTGVQDFHIVFLISLLSYAGIRPDMSGYKPGLVFEFSSGSFIDREHANPPFIDGEFARVLPFLSRLNYANMKCLRLNNANRRQILYEILNYYSYHFPGLGTLKSPEILREIFD